MIDATEEILDSLSRIKMTATPRLLMKRAEEMGWSIQRTTDDRLVYLIAPEGQKHPLFGINTSLNSYLGTAVASSKIAAALVVEDIAPNLLIPSLTASEFNQDAANFLKQHSTVVVKPDGGAHGNDVILNITSESALKSALEKLATNGRKVIVQKYIEGQDHRLLVVGDKVVAAVKRIPANIIGDGKHTIRQLIEVKNAAPRDENTRGALSTIPMGLAEDYLGPELDTVPASSEDIQVVAVSNLSKGGKAIDSTDEIPAKLAENSVKIANRVGLGVMGIDFLIDTSHPDKAYFLEFNSQPGIRMHHFPAEGEPRDVAGPILELLRQRTSKSGSQS